MLTVHKSIALFSAIILLLWVPAVIAESCVSPEPALESNPLPIDLSGGVPADPNGYIGEWEYSDPTIHVKIESGRVSGCDYWVAGYQNRPRLTAAHRGRGQFLFKYGNARNSHRAACERHSCD